MKSTVEGGRLEHVPMSSLYVSTPDPRMFGNPANPVDTSSWTKDNWLESVFHFNFAEYHGGSPSFGVLRVLNWDTVQPNRGFGKHPHRDMEIVTLVVRGQLTHQDSMGTAETLGPGSIQFMTAGTGVLHSERNLSVDEDLHFLQLWIVPRKSGLQPNYGSLRGDAYSIASGQWKTLVTDVQHSDRPDVPIKINQDVNLSVAKPSKEHPVSLKLSSGRQAYVVQIEGASSLLLNGQPGGQDLQQGDACRLYGPAELSFTNEADAAGHVLVVEMKQARS